MSKIKKHYSCLEEGYKSTEQPVMKCNQYLRKPNVPEKEPSRLHEATVVPLTKCLSHSWTLSLDIIRPARLYKNPLV